MTCTKKNLQYFATIGRNFNNRVMKSAFKEEFFPGQVAEAEAFGKSPTCEGIPLQASGQLDQVLTQHLFDALDNCKLHRT